MPAGTLNLEIEQGARYLKVITWKDSDGVEISLAGYEARMHIRESIDAEDPPLLELTTTNGRIILEDGGNTGRVTLDVGADVTEVIDWVSGVYDLELVETADPTNVTRLIKGKVTVDLEVTR